MTGKRESTGPKRRASRPVPNLGQKKAELEKASDEQLSHMEGGKAAKAAREKKATITRRDK
jgi:hypothetical protein